MTDDRPRPPRRHIPIRVMLYVCERQLWLCKRCGVEEVHAEPSTTVKTHFDHEPALRLRDINRDGTDYDPPQHSAAHLDALCAFCHYAKTHGTGASTAGTDVGKIKKERKRQKAMAGIAPKNAKIKSRGFRKDLTRGFDGKIRNRNS